MVSDVNVTSNALDVLNKYNYTKLYVLVISTDIAFCSLLAITSSYSILTEAELFCMSCPSRAMTYFVPVAVR